MLHKGMAIICRTEEELKALIAVIHKTPYLWTSGERITYRNCRYMPIRLSINTYKSNACVSRCDQLDYQLNEGITEVYEASDFLHNQIISIKLKGE